MHVSKSDGRVRFAHEESPSSTGQGAG